MKKIVLLTALLALMLAANASVKASPAQLCECEQAKGDRADRTHSPPEARTFAAKVAGHLFLAAHSVNT